MLYFHLEGLTQSSAVRSWAMHEITVGEMDTVQFLLISPTPAAGHSSGCEVTVFPPAAWAQWESHYFKFWFYSTSG